MAYVVRDSNNNIVATVADNTVDNSTTISLIGKNYVGYGTALNQNLVRMMEHFSKDTQPSNAILGQIWYDTTTDDLKVYNGSSFVQAIKTVANLSAGNITVTGTISAANITNGNSNVSIAPNGSVTITSSSNSTMTITSTGANIAGTANISGNANVGNLGATTVVATTGNITTVNATTANATTVNSGLMQNGNSNVTITANSVVSIAANGAVRMTVAANGYVGIGMTPVFPLDITAALGNMRLQSSTGTNYAQLQVVNGSGTARFGVEDSVGGNIVTGGSAYSTVINQANAYSLHLGTNNTVRVTINSSGNVGIANTAPTHTLSVTGTMNISGAANIGSTLDVTGNITSGNLATSVITANGTVFTQGATGAFVTRRRDTNADAYHIYSAAGELRLYDAAGAADRVILSAGGNLHPNGNGTQQLGLTGSRWSNIWGLASSAQYADLAEKYRSDADYEPGTVLEIGGEHEITVCNTPRSDKVFGCVSTDPAYLMNDVEKEGIWLPVVLTGRAPIRVAGLVNKGDRLVSAGNGAAMAAGTFSSSYQTEIGRALETKNTEEIELIEAYISTR